MDNTFILNPKLEKLDLIDAIDERLTHIKAILSCILATEGSNFNFCDDAVYDLAMIMQRLANEIEQMQFKLIVSN
jgi:hypothetical protein